MSSKKMFLALLLSLLIASVAFTQDQKNSPDGRFKRIQAHLGWTIINALDLDIESEKGRKVLDILNKRSKAEHDYYSIAWKEKNELRDKMKPAKYDVQAVEAMLLEIENNRKNYLSSQISFFSEIELLLTPHERAKLMVAEEGFRQRVRNAMRNKSNSRSSRRHNSPPPSRNR